MADSQRPIIYVYQIFLPAFIKHQGLKVASPNMFERFYAFHTEIIRNRREEKRSTPHLEYLVHDFHEALRKKGISLIDYRIENLPIAEITGESPLSFESSLKTYGQDFDILRLPLFPEDFQRIEQEFKGYRALDRLARTPAHSKLKKYSEIYPLIIQDRVMRKV